MAELTSDATDYLPTILVTLLKNENKLSDFQTQWNEWISAHKNEIYKSPATARVGTEADSSIDFKKSLINKLANDDNYLGKQGLNPIDRAETNTKNTKETINSDDDLISEYTGAGSYLDIPTSPAENADVGVASDVAGLDPKSKALNLLASAKPAAKTLGDDVLDPYSNNDKLTDFEDLFDDSSSADSQRQQIDDTKPGFFKRAAKGATNLIPGVREFTNWFNASTEPENAESLKREYGNLENEFGQNNWEDNVAAAKKLQEKYTNLRSKVNKLEQTAEKTQLIGDIDKSIQVIDAFINETVPPEPVPAPPPLGTAVSTPEGPSSASPANFEVASVTQTPQRKAYTSMDDFLAQFETLAKFRATLERTQVGLNVKAYRRIANGLKEEFLDLRDRENDFTNFEFVSQNEADMIKKWFIDTLKLIGLNCKEKLENTKNKQTKAQLKALIRELPARITNLELTVLRPGNEPTPPVIE